MMKLPAPPALELRDVALLCAGAAAGAAAAVVALGARGGLRSGAADETKPRSEPPPDDGGVTAGGVAGGPGPRSLFGGSSPWGGGGGAAARADPGLAVFTEADLAEEREGECLMAIDGLVYDVGPFLGGHPGGRGTLLASRGSDASAEFHAFHKPEVLAETAAGFVVGRYAPAGDTARMSLVVDGAKTPGSPAGSWKVNRCSGRELGGLRSVAAFEAEATERGQPSLIRYVLLPSEWGGGSMHGRSNSP